MNCMYEQNLGGFFVNDVGKAVRKGVASKRLEACAACIFRFFCFFDFLRWLYFYWELTLTVEMVSACSLHEKEGEINLFT